MSSFASRSAIGRFVLVLVGFILYRSGARARQPAPHAQHQARDPRGGVVRAAVNRFRIGFDSRPKRQYLGHPKQTSGSLTSRIALAGAASTMLLAARVSGATTDETVPPISVGAGLQTSIYGCEKSCIYSPSTVPAGDSSVQGIAVDSIRLYIDGSVTNTLKLTFNTEYTGSGSGPGDNKVEVMDAIGRFEYNNYFNIWAGRFLPPSDRANLYGPYYANDWAPYADGVADFYPDVAVGRDNGLAYWGDTGMLKVQAGVFDGETVNSAVANKSTLLYAVRLTMDFWDKETGYYLNGTSYGDKDLLALGVAAQSQDSKTTASIDALMEKKLPNLGVVTIEAEYNRDNSLTSATSSDGWYGLAAYVFPVVVGIGKFQILGKYSQKTIDTRPLVDKLKTTEVNLNYIIKSFSARVGFYYLNQKDRNLDTSPNEFGLKLQLQM